MDLFGDETEEDKKAAEEREAAKKSAKKKESMFLSLDYISSRIGKCQTFAFVNWDPHFCSKLGNFWSGVRFTSHLMFCHCSSLGGKSSVLMDVKPWDDETDMKKLEEAVRSVEMPGLLWGACTV